MGLKPTEVVKGYKLACRKALEVLEGCACHEIKDAKNNDKVQKAVRTAVISILFGHDCSEYRFSDFVIVFGILDFMTSTAFKNFKGFTAGDIVTFGNWEYMNFGRT